MGTAELAAAALLACALAGLGLGRLRRRAARGEGGLARDVNAVLCGIAGPLGDAVLAFDASGRIAFANAAARSLAGPGAGPVGRLGHDLLGEDLAVLLRGLGRGPAAGRVVIVGPGGRARALAAAVRVSGAPTVDVVALRLEPEPAPAPPRPAPDPVAELADADILDGSMRAAPLATGAAALASELRGPLSRAAASIALLRLALPRGQAAGDEHLARAQRELRQVEAALSALAAPLAAAAPRPLDLGALAGEAAAAARFAPGVRVRRVGGGVVAVADAAQLREAVHHLLALAARAMPAGGELGLRVARRGGEAVLEIADSGASGDGGLDLALAERLVAAQGGRVERAAVPGRGTLARVRLPAAQPAATRVARAF